MKKNWTCCYWKIKIERNYNFFFLKKEIATVREYEEKGLTLIVYLHRARHSVGQGVLSRLVLIFSKTEETKQRNINCAITLTIL